MDDIAPRCRWSDLLLQRADSALRSAVGQDGIYPATRAKRPAEINGKPSHVPAWVASAAEWQPELRPAGFFGRVKRLVSPSVGGDLFGRRSRCRKVGPLLVAHGLGRDHRPIATLLVRFHGFSLRSRNVPHRMANAGAAESYQDVRST